MTEHLAGQSTGHLAGHLTEDQLIAYQLGEGSGRARVAAHLERCAVCAALAESIAETLRVFSADALPEPNLEHSWQRLRGSLPALAPRVAARPARGWRGPLAWITGAALTAGMLGGLVELRVHRALVSRPLERPVETARVPAGLRPGPLTAEPRDPQLAAHLENAERLLTEVGHASGPLDQPTREQARQLLVSNALYVERAQRAGDPAEASVLEELGRTLTMLEHEPPAEEPGVHVRVEMNTSGLLLDLRILEQNDNDAAARNAKDDRQ